MSNRSRFGISRRNRIITQDRIYELVRDATGNRRLRRATAAILRRHSRAEVTHGEVEVRRVGEVGYGKTPVRRYFKVRGR